MKFNDIQSALEKFRKLQQTQAAYDHVLGVLFLDATTVAPKDTWEGRGKTMEIMSQITYDLMASPENGELFDYLLEHHDALDGQTKRELEVLRKNYEQMKKIPADEYVAYSVLLNDAQNVWERAKNEDDFPSFAPYLEKIVDYNRKFAHYYDPDKAPYDALLNEYEEGLDMATLDEFFGKLRIVIAQLLKRIGSVPQIDDSFLHAHYPVEKQREFSDYLMEVLGMDRSHCGIAET